MAEIIRIDMPKGTEDGQTSLSPQSPTRSNVESPPITRKGAFIAGTVAMAGSQIYQGLTQDLAEGGNEELANQLKNVATGSRILITAGLTGGYSLIAEGAGAVISKSFNARSVARQNKAREFEREMKGARNDYMNGGGW